VTSVIIQSPSLEQNTLRLMMAWIFHHSVPPGILSGSPRADYGLVPSGPGCHCYLKLSSWNNKLSLDHLCPWQ
jgi:hypothetical protein